MLALEGTENGLSLTPILIRVNDGGGRIKRRKVASKDCEYIPGIALFRLAHFGLLISAHFGLFFISAYFFISV